MAEGNHLSNQFDSREAHVHVSPLRKFCFGLGELGFGTSDYLVESFSLTYFAVVLHVNPAIIGTAMFLPRIIDAFTAPIMGHISDKTRTRWGRRRPYLLFGAPMVGVMTFLIYAAPAGVSERALFTYLFIVGLLYVLLYAVVYVPYSALGAELAMEYDERTRLQTWKSVIAQGAIIAAASTWWLARRPIFPDERTGALFVVGFYCVLIVLALWASFWGTREEAAVQTTGSLHLIAAFKETLTNRAFLVLAGASTILLFTFFCGFSLSNFVSIYYVFGGADRDGAAAMMTAGSAITSVFGVFGSVFWGWAAVRLGKDRAFRVSLAAVLLISPLSLVFFTPAHPYLQLAFVALIQLAFGTWLILPSAMMADICDADELRTGCRREGAYSGVMGLLMKSSAAVALMASGYIINFAGFQEALEVQSESFVTRIRWLYVLIPVATIGASFLLMLFYPLHEKRAREIRRLLDERRTAGNEAPSGG